MLTANQPAKVSLRQTRRAAAVALTGLNNQGRMLEDVVLPALKTLTEHTDATMTRAESLEREMEAQRVMLLEQIHTLLPVGVWGRLRWLVTGR